MIADIAGEGAQGGADDVDHRDDVRDLLAPLLPHVRHHALLRGALSHRTPRECCTKRQNEVNSEVWELFSQSSTDAPALLPCAMLPRQARGINAQEKPTLHSICLLVLDRNRSCTRVGISGA